MEQLKHLLAKRVLHCEFIDLQYQPKQKIIMKITFITKQLPVLLLIALFSAACGSKKTGSMSNVLPSQTLDGYRGYALSVTSAQKGSSDVPEKIEIIPGKMMEVDCNNHSLIGEFVQKQLSDGNYYNVYESKGEAISTLMGCPDNTKRMDFVQGQTLFIDADNAASSMVFASEGIEIRRRVWTPSSAYEMGKELNNIIETEATEALKAYPKSLEGYDRYVLILPEIKNSQKERKVEIIPGVTTEVDCNKHGLGGRFVEKDVEGWGYSYLIFESDGSVRSTRMACPDDTRRTEVVTGATQLLNYNSRLPIVVFIPKKDNFSVQYRIWEAGEVK